jgi:hypothetical protein
MLALVDPRTALAVIVILTLANAGLGRDLPFATNALVPFLVDLVLFVGYLYLARTLFRLPFALLIAVRRARLAQVRYGLSLRESLRDGIVRGFLERRRWNVGQLALLDRLALFLITLESTTPMSGVLLVKLGGIFGLALMLIIYLMTGTFSLLLDDSRNSSPVSLPFLDVQDR